MKSLYHIESDYLSIINQVIEQDGELTPEQEQALEITQQELEVKSIAYVQCIKTAEAYISGIDTEIKRLQALKKQNENLVDKLKSNLLNAVNIFGSFTAGFHKFGTRKSTSVNVTIEANALPKEFKTVKITEAPDKVAIKKALEAGEVIEGCELITNYNLTIK